MEFQDKGERINIFKINVLNVIELWISMKEIDCVLLPEIKNIKNTQKYRDLGINLERQKSDF